MRIKKEHAALAAIFLGVLLLRLYFAFQSSTFTPDSYFDIREIVNIRFFGTPIYEDALSFSGRMFFFLPLFHYIMSFLSLFFSLQFVLKIAPNLFASLTIIIVYLIALKLTKNITAALASALASGFIPIFIFRTVTSVSALSLLIPIFFFLIYCLMQIEKKGFVWLFIIGLLVLVFMHPFSMLFVAGLLFYISLLKLEQIKHSPAETELVLFATLITTSITFLIFKEPFLTHGPALIWQNIPDSILNKYFVSFNVIDDIFKIGAVPFVAGLFVIYKYILRQHVKDIYLFFSFSFVTLLLLWLRLINLDIGLIVLGIIFCILLAQFVALFLNYLEHTRLSSQKALFIIALFMLIAITSGLPSLQYAENSVAETVSENEIKALLWFKGNTGSDSVILSGINEGHLITGIAERRNVADSNFLLVSDAAQRVSDIDEIYSTPYKVEAIRLLNKYKVDYILLTRRTVQHYQGPVLTYAADKNCFEIVFENKAAQIYRSLCGV